MIHHRRAPLPAGGPLRHAHRTPGRGIRRRARLAAGALVVGVALTACAPGRTDVAEVRFWSFTGIDQASQVAEFMESHPGIRIELSEVGTSAETADALTAALAAGSPPDLVLIQADDMPRFLSASDRFFDLRDLGADAPESEYLSWARAGGVTPAGEVIGVPTDVGGMSVAYRVDLFQAAGLPTDPDEVAALWPTWQDFVEVGERYTTSTGSAFVDNIGTTIFTNAANQLEAMYYSADGELIYDRNPQLRQAFDLSVRAHEQGISAGMPAFSTGWAAGISRGAFAVMPAPSWMLRVIKGNAPELAGQWRIAPAPGAAGNWGGSYLAVPAGARNPDAAWQYIASTQSSHAQRRHFLSGGPLPAAAAPYSDGTVASFSDEYFGASKIGAVFAASLTGMGYVPRGPQTSVINREFLSALEAAEQGAVAPALAWDSAVAAVAVALDRTGP